LDTALAAAGYSAGIKEILPAVADTVTALQRSPTMKRSIFLGFAAVLLAAGCIDSRENVAKFSTTAGDSLWEEPGHMERVNAKK
jgi:hypothetical protein